MLGLSYLPKSAPETFVGLFVLHVRSRSASVVRSSGTRVSIFYRNYPLSNSISDQSESNTEISLFLFLFHFRSNVRQVCSKSISKMGVKLTSGILLTCYGVVS